MTRAIIMQRATARAVVRANAQPLAFVTSVTGPVVTPVVASDLITQSGDFLITQSGDFLVTQG